MSDTPPLEVTVAPKIAVLVAMVVDVGNEMIGVVGVVNDPSAEKVVP